MCPWCCLQVENSSTEELARSSLTFVPQPSDDGAIVLCMATNPELRTDKKFVDDRKMTDSLILSVVCEYQPSWTPVILGAAPYCSTLYDLSFTTNKILWTLFLKGRVVSCRTKNPITFSL